MTRSTRRRTFVGLAALSLVAAVFAAQTRAGDATPTAAPTIKSKFFRGFVGSWDTEVSEGAMGRAKGHSKWHLTIGETAAIEEYEATITGADGSTHPMSAHIVVRETGDGKGIEAWMFDDASIAPAHFVGAYTDAGFEAKAETPQGTMRVTCEAKGNDRVFHLYMGDTLLQLETYRPAAK
jgi:hypothetical protein